MSYIPALIAELRAHGATDISVDMTRSHPRINFLHDGRPRFFVTSATPSDGRAGVHNALASLRRVLGVRRIIRKSTAPPRKRCNPRPVALPDTFTVAPNPFDALAKLRRDL